MTFERTDADNTIAQLGQIAFHDGAATRGRIDFGRFSTSIDSVGFGFYVNRTTSGIVEAMRLSSAFTGSQTTMMGGLKMQGKQERVTSSNLDIEPDNFIYFNTSTLTTNNDFNMLDAPRS